MSAQQTHRKCITEMLQLDNTFILFHVERYIRTLNVFYRVSKHLFPKNYYCKIYICFSMLTKDNQDQTGF